MSKDDWIEWLRRLSIELLKESPSPALRSCWALAQSYSTLARCVQGQGYRQGLIGLACEVAQLNVCCCVNKQGPVQCGVCFVLDGINGGAAR